MNRRQKRFVDEYLIDLNATQAAIRAGYSQKYADRMAYKLVENSRVQEYITKRMNDRQKRTEITQDKVLLELAKIAFTNGSDFAKVVTKPHKELYYNRDAETYEEREVIRQHVELVDTDALSDDKKAAISAIKETKFGIAVESCDKLKALELIGRHLGMFKEKVELTGQVNNPYEGLTKEQLLKIAGVPDVGR